jgi:hypothetical protein
MCTECPKDTDSDLVFKRDFVWMAYNVLRYLMSEERYDEAA